jgi:hypothetical protein
MMPGFKLYLVVLTVVGSLLAFGCESVEQPKTVSHDQQLKILPAHGLLDAKLLTAGLALDEERVKQCQAFEKKWARDRQSPPIIIPNQPIKLRSEPRNARPEEVDAAVMKYNFNLGDNRRNGCFINALQASPEGTVIDYATRLMWKYKPSAAVSRSDADEYIRSLNEKKYSGYSDWRLPTTEEMASLIDWHGYGTISYVDPYFFRRRGVNYMTADTYKYEGVDRVWIVKSFVRLISISNSKDEPAHVQAVRSL